MKKIYSMTLYANESVRKEAAKGISQRGHKNLSFRFLLILTLFVNIVFFSSCNKDDYDIIGDDDVVENTNNSSLEVRDFKNWFESQTIAKGLIGEQEPDWSKAELKMMQDGKTLHVSIEIYKGKNFLENDSIRELEIVKLENGFIGNVKVLSFYDRENAYAKYYSLSGRIFDEGEYYAPKQLYISLERYAVEMRIVRLKSGNESDDPCAGTQMYINSATPYTINGAPNPAAYNCHAYVWGTLSSSSPCYMSSRPLWNNCPNISGSGYSQVSTPQVGDRWVSYGYHPNYGNNSPIHSAFVYEVKNGKVTKLKAKCGDGGIYIYNPDCTSFANYMTNNVKYYR